jgi:hypothetical protein
MMSVRNPVIVIVTIISVGAAVGSGGHIYICRGGRRRRQGCGGDREKFGQHPQSAD